MSTNPATVVYVSDTPYTCPSIPPDDLLLHAGDLSQFDPFEEIQIQLDWLNAQLHTHQIIIAETHDKLLDAKFVANDLSYEHAKRKGRDNLQWVNLIYSKTAPHPLI